MLGILLLCILFAPLPAAAQVISVGNGRISGQLLDGTRKNAPLTGQVVTLQEAQGANAQDAATATTDVHGKFSFANLSTDKTISYAVYMRYQGAQYVSDLVSLDSKPVQQLNLTVYEATSSVKSVVVLQATILVHEPDAQKGTIAVSEVIFFRNLDTHTYVGSLDASRGKPKALLFSLPRGARSVTLSNGFDGYRAIQVDRGFASDATLPPGDTQFAFSFDAPYSASFYDFSYVTNYPTLALSVLVPPDVHATSSVLASQGLINADQHAYQSLKTSTLLANQELHIGLEGLPTSAAPTGASSLNPLSIWLVLALLLALAVLLVTWLVLRSSRRRATLARGKKGRPGSKPGAGKKVGAAPGDRREVLLQDLLELDKAFEAGKLSRTLYQERRSRAKARLRSLISEEEEART
jgi:hypothetical protein